MYIYIYIYEVLQCMYINICFHKHFPNGRYVYTIYKHMSYRSIETSTYIFLSSFDKCIIYKSILISYIYE